MDQSAPSLQLMNAGVGEGLDHIPRGAGAQNHLRMVFNAIALANMRNGRPLNESLAQALATAERDWPGHTFSYDQAWFAAQVPSTT
jgi:hypothetical protein